MPQHVRLGRCERRKVAAAIESRNQQDARIHSLTVMAMASSSQAISFMRDIAAASSAAGVASQGMMVAVTMQSMQSGLSRVAGPDFVDDTSSTSDDDPFYPGATYAPKAGPQQRNALQPQQQPTLAGVWAHPEENRQRSPPPVPKAPKRVQSCSVGPAQPSKRPKPAVGLPPLKKPAQPSKNRPRREEDELSYESVPHSYTEESDSYYDESDEGNASSQKDMPGSSRAQPAAVVPRQSPWRFDKGENKKEGEEKERSCKEKDQKRTEKITSLQSLDEVRHVL